MNNDLIIKFKELENLNCEIDKINAEIKNHINLFDDPEESNNPIVIKLLEEKDLYLGKYNLLKKETKKTINIDVEPIGLESNYFINMFSTTQERLNYINKKLDKEIILDGTNELFTSLAYESKVKSYSPFRIMYVAYKFPKIFNQNITIIYEKTSSSDLKYEEVEEKIIYPSYEGEVEYK